MSRKRHTLVILLLVVVAVVALALCRWQLRRLSQRKASNAVQLAARALPPLDLTDAVRNNTPLTDRRLRVRGHFDPAAQILLRGRVQDDAPGLQVATRFVVDSTAAAIWVLRGFVPSPDAVTPPDSIAAPESGPVTIDGLARPLPASSGGPKPIGFHGDSTWMVLDSLALQRRDPATVGVYLLLADDSRGAGRLETVPPEPLTNGPHLSYAIQWLLIAGGALGFAGLIMVRSRRGPGERVMAP